VDLSTQNICFSSDSAEIQPCFQFNTAFSLKIGKNLCKSPQTSVFVASVYKKVPHCGSSTAPGIFWFILRK
jgi:hypothetical protein